MALQASSSDLVHDLVESTSRLLDLIGSEGSLMSIDSYEPISLEDNRGPTVPSRALDRNNVDRIEKVLRKHRRYKGHLVREAKSLESAMADSLRKACKRATIWQQAINFREGLSHSMKELMAKSLSLGQIEIDHFHDFTNESLPDSPTSSSFGASSEEGSNTPERFDESTEKSITSFRDLKWKKPLPPDEVAPIDDEKKNIPWDNNAVEEPNESSTDSLYDIDLSSDDTPGDIKQLPLRAKYYKLLARHQKGAKLKKPELISAVSWNRLVNTSNKILNEAVEIAKDALSPNEFEKPTLSYDKRKKEEKIKRKRLWEKHLSPLISDAAKKLEILEASLDAELANCTSSCKRKLGENFAAETILFMGDEPKKMTTDQRRNVSPAGTLSDIQSSKPPAKEMNTTTRNEKPYHIICQERLRKAAVDEQHRFDRILNDFCSSSTFALDGMCFKEIMKNRNCLPMLNDEFYKQFKLSAKDKRRLERLLKD